MNKKLLYLLLPLPLVLMLLIILKTIFYPKGPNYFDPMLQAVSIKSVEFFTHVDRCDPFSCTDRFQVGSVKRLDMPVRMANTGAVKIGSGFTHFDGDWVEILESKKRLGSGGNYEQKTCKKGEYLVALTQRNWFYYPIDEIRLCYHLLLKG